MPRNMSFAATIPQMVAGTKTVTRRTGWNNLKPGQKVWAVENCMGLKKGESAKKICLIEIVSVRSEPLETITQEDVVAEGFPGLDVYEFTEMFAKIYKIPFDHMVNRFEFKFIAWVQ